VYQQQQQEQQEQQEEQQQDAENPFLDPPFSRIKTAKSQTQVHFFDTRRRRSVFFSAAEQILKLINFRTSRPSADGLLIMQPQHWSEADFKGVFVLKIIVLKIQRLIDRQ
jgi:hypothetical protein